MTEFSTFAGRGDKLRYMQVAKSIDERIRSGIYEPGRRLPGENELAGEFGVSRPTVRRALRSLGREGLVTTRRGVGSFVSRTRVRQTLAHLEALDDTIAEQGLTSTTRILDYAFTTPSVMASRALALEDDARVLFVRRLHLVDGEPIALVDISLPDDIGAQFSRRDTEDQAFYRLLTSRSGIDLGAATQSIRAEKVSASIARGLGAPEGSPCLVCERVTYDTAGRPLIHALFSYPADQFEFRVSLATHEWNVPWGSPGLNPLNAAAAR